MFGMGFTEILIIAVIAILFLGPDKLPGAMVDIAKFFRSTKNAINSVKDTIEEEIHVSDIKKEALAYKKELTKTSENISKVTSIDGINGLADSLFEEENLVSAETKREKEEDIVSFKKSKEKDKDEVEKEEVQNA